MVFFVAGLEKRYCAIVGALAMVGLVLFTFAKPYRLARVVKFFDPDFKFIEKVDKQGNIKARLQQSLVTRDTNYQLQQSQIAVGAGGAIGLGFMNGRQKLLYLPEAHKDFIYAVVGEELGMIGSRRPAARFLHHLLARPARHRAHRRRFRPLSGARASPSSWWCRASCT